MLAAGLGHLTQPRLSKSRIRGAIGSVRTAEKGATREDQTVARRRMRFMPQFSRRASASGTNSAGIGHCRTIAAFVFKHVEWIQPCWEGRHGTFDAGCTA